MLTRINSEQRLLALMVWKLLEKPEQLVWSVQGMGMLRTYINYPVRIDIWADQFVKPNVSLIHNHPWSFESTVLCGELYNHVFYPESLKLPEFERSDELTKHINAGSVGMAKRYYRAQIKAGEAAHVTTEPTLDVLRSICEVVTPGRTYAMPYHVPHATQFQDLTLTVVQRQNHPHLSKDHALVWWPEADGPKGWVDAEPYELSAPLSENVLLTIETIRELLSDQWGIER